MQDDILAFVDDCEMIREGVEQRRKRYNAVGVHVENRHQRIAKNSILE